MTTSVYRILLGLHVVSLIAACAVHAYRLLIDSPTHSSAEIMMTSRGFEMVMAARAVQLFAGTAFLAGLSTLCWKTGVTKNGIALAVSTIAALLLLLFAPAW